MDKNNKYLSYLFTKIEINKKLHGINVDVFFQILLVPPHAVFGACHSQPQSLEKVME